MLCRFRVSVYVILNHEAIFKHIKFFWYFSICDYSGYLINYKYELLFQVATSESVQFGVMDHVITHCGPNNLFLYYSVWADLSTEFLNRVRLNTIKNYQVCSADFV